MHTPTRVPAPRATGYTATTDVPLFWAAYGESGAPRVLVLHGGPGADHEYLLPQMLELADERELLFYDQRGGGRSRTDDRGTVTWQTHVADLAAVVRELGLEPLTLIGYSWGGLLALLYAATAAVDAALPVPKRLAVIDPAPVSRQFRDQFEAEFARRQAAPAVQALRDELLASGLRERDPEAFRQRAFELSVAGYFADPRAARNLTPFRVVGRIQQSVWESLGDYDLVADGRLGTIRSPVLVVHGREDPIPLASSEACARAVGGELVVLDGCGHVPYVEQPAALFAALKRFLA
ncbi:MAG: alpha/beta hydrolase [Gemmatimonadota bacterium]|nr:alpha/beta hydrolase [Gemmatimonadota bacterium]MDE3215455.1 alpha/beta hydrolase [Gemmatimonadota bacterium]